MMSTKTKKKPAAQSHMEKAASLNSDNLIVIDADKPTRRLVTKCCRSTPILYLTGNASCGECGKYFRIWGDMLKRYPKLISRSSADAAAQRMGVDSSENVVRSTREAKAPATRKPLEGQKEFSI